MPDIQHDPCPQCGKPPAMYEVLHGWHPCSCGGHRTRRCRADKGGCGHAMYVPALNPEVCTPPRDGFPSLAAPG
jgi:hypothetical protein